MTEGTNDDLHEVLEDSNPNASGSDQLGGGMGVSSERVIDPAEDTIEGTGTHGSAVDGTNGTTDTSAAEPTDESGTD